jgi:hypothetical protein
LRRLFFAKELTKVRAEAALGGSGVSEKMLKFNPEALGEGVATLKAQLVDAAQPPERKSKPEKALIAIITTLATGFVLLLFVFVRRAMQNADQVPESVAKLAAVRNGFARVIKP